MKFHILLCLPAASAATCWSLNTSGSRVAVSSERYSIRILPVRTHFWISVGSAPSVKSLQMGHCRSPKYSHRDGRGGAAERVAASAGCRRASVLTGLSVFPPRRLLPGATFLDLPLPPVATRMTTIATTTTATTLASWVRRVAVAPRLRPRPPPWRVRCERACSRRCLRVRSSSSLSTGLMGGTFTDFCSTVPKYCLTCPAGQTVRGVWVCPRSSAG